MPHPLAAMFMTNHDYLNNLGRGSPKQHFSQAILKWVRGYLTRRILKFSVQIYMENKPRPLGTMFFDVSGQPEQSW